MENALRVLVADDETLVAELVKGQLDDLGFTVVGDATDGRQAIEMTRSLRPDVVIMDLWMPGMDGFRATREIQRSCPTPVVALTAHDVGESVERAIAAGAGAYLVKPSRPQDVGRAITMARVRFGEQRQRSDLIAELASDKAELQLQVETLRQGRAEAEAVRAGRPAPRNSPDASASRGSRRREWGQTRRGKHVLARMEGLERERDALAEATDALSLGLVFVDRCGRALFANQLAETILKQHDGLCFSSGRILVATPGQPGVLQALSIGETASGRGKGLKAGSAMAVPRPSNLRPYTLFVVPLQTHDRTAGADEVAAVVFISDPEEQVEAPRELLERLYGFSRAESGVCAPFLRGKSVEAIAQELDLSVHTVRSHLKRLLAKTGERRQTELMRLLLRGPAGLRFE